jgi:hypothetical protein
MIWREKRVWLIVLGLMLAADVFFFVTYRVQFQKRKEDVEARRVQSEAQLAKEHSIRMTAEETYARYGKLQADLDALYNSRWATQSERLTPWINEIKKMAVASQLVPRILSFGHDEDKGSATLAGTKLKGIGTITASVTYSVQGNYQQVRRLINLLELSDQFVIIDSLTVSAGGSDPNLLTLNLRLKTLFREPRTGPAAPRTQQIAATPIK